MILVWKFFIFSLKEREKVIFSLLYFFSLRGVWGELSFLFSFLFVLGIGVFWVGGKNSCLVVWKFRRGVIVLAKLRL